MANVRYNVDCPSCEASVPIRSSAMIGKKTECPKCKYRFTVPEPPGDDAAEDAPKKNTKAASGKKSKPAKSGSKKMLYVGAGVGVLAIGLLVVVAIFIFGGSGDEGTTKADTTTAPANNTAKAGGPGEGLAGAMGGEVAAGPGGAGPGGTGREGDGSSPPMAPGDAAPPKVDTKIAGTGGSQKDVTNLLPGDTTAVYRVNFDRLAQNATPLSNGFFDAKVRDLFRNSMTFGSDQLAVYIHCIVGPDRDPFVLLRTKSAIDEVRIIQDMKLEKIPNGVKNGREFFTVKSNAFIDSLSQAFTTQTITKMLGIPFPGPSQKDRDEAAKKKYALCVYDSQTILIASTLIMERFLDDLQLNGYPSFKSELTTTEAAPPAANPMGEGGPGGGSGSPGAVGGPPPRGSNNNSSVDTYQNTPMKPGAGGQPPPGSSGAPPGGFPGAGMMQPGGGPGGAEQRPPARKLFTSIPTYRTIDPPLKKTLNQLEEDEKNPPAIVYAEIIDQRVLNTRDLNDIYKVTGNATAGMLARIKLLGGSLSHLSKEKGDGTVVMEFVSDDDAKKTVAESIMPTLQTVTPAVDLLLGTQTQVRNSLGQPGGNGPGGFGGPGADGGFGGPGAPPGSGGGGRGSPGGFPGAPPGSGGGFPGGPGAPGGEGSTDGGGFPGGPGGFPGGPGGFGTGGNGLPAGRNQGTVELTLSDKVLVIAILLNWPEDKFNSYIQPQLQRTASQMKGRMSVLTGDIEWHRLAVVSNKLQDGKRMFPRGTIDREASDTRYRLAYPPEQRVSFFADLLPFLGHSGLRSQIDDKKMAWYSKENLAAAETWIPELLVPYYPQDSWRATHPLAEGRILGATNFVAPAGLGLDAGRYNPADPEMAKKVGITGYNWGSKPEEIKDGLSNTIYLLQAAPGTGRPWIAGGGATVVGVEDSDNPMQPFTHRLPDGRRGTYALMADGSVRFIKEGTDPKVFKALVTRAGNESIADLDKTAPKIAATRSTETDLRGGPSIKTPTPTPSSAPTTDSAEVNDAELKKFQGTWKVTFFKMKALSKMAPPEALAQVKLEMSFDGKKLGIKVKGPMGDLPIPVPGAEIVKLDSAASPKILDMKGADGKTSQGIYEFTSDSKLKIRSTNDKSRPTKMGVPDDKSDDGYFELEKAN